MRANSDPAHTFLVEEAEDNLDLHREGAAWDWKTIAPILLSGLALSGCGASVHGEPQANTDLKTKVSGVMNRHTGTFYTDGIMREQRLPNTTIDTFCVGRTLLQITFSLHVTASKNHTQVKTHHTTRITDDDPMCADGKITPSDFGEPAPTTQELPSA